MKINNCPICHHERIKYFEAQVLCKYEVSYLFCTNCGFLQTEKPYWLDEAYSNVIADADTGLVARNISISKKLACILFFLFPKEGKYLDVAGGYGMLTRLMRDIGFDFYWSDIYCENILAKGFERSTNDKLFSAITAFEVLEHVHNPIEFIQSSLKEFNVSTIVFSTELFQGSPPSPESWWYYTLETGQHISFYQLKTLNFIADKLSLNLYSHKNTHILTDKHISKKIIWKLMTSRFSKIIYKYIKKQMKSKTVSDHKLILNKIK
jgi:2-polyprenyl-3-methyl-5-hydroxy-6-metoxy-1,4-benzoquinol methylase